MFFFTYFTKPNTFGFPGKENIKNLKITAVKAGILGLILTGGTASASYNDLNFYVGTGLDYAKYSVSKDFLAPGESAKSKGFSSLLIVL